MLVYVQPGPVSDDGTILCQTLNLLRAHYGDFELRTDPGDAPTTAAARRWAQLRNLPTQHHGLPDAILVPDYPGGDPAPEAMTPQKMSEETGRVNAQARRDAGLTPLERILAPLRPASTVIWLGRPQSQKEQEKPGPQPQPMY